VFLLSPLLIGLFAGGRWTTPTLYLIIAATAGFLVRQPVTIVVKVLSGRRPREELPAALFWTTLYTAVGLLHVLGLVVRGFGALLTLAVPGVPIFAWYLRLVAKRAERRQLAVELAGSGVLASSAAAAFWVGRGEADPLGWILWALTWAQSAGSILHATLRLTQRPLREIPPVRSLFWMGRLALSVTTGTLLIVAALSLSGLTPAYLPIPFALQWAETLWGTLRPAAGWRPTAIGLRQLAVSSLFTLLFILAWRM
jgi:hypothetical protein